MANDLPPGNMRWVTGRFGLCDGCSHQRLVKSGRGSLFSMCLRHKTDPRYRKYPPMPVARCEGFERRRPDTPGSSS